MGEELKVHLSEAALTVVVYYLLQCRLLLYVRIVTFGAGEGIDHTFKLNQIEILARQCRTVRHVLLVHYLISHN